VGATAELTARGGDRGPLHARDEQVERTRLPHEIDI
jgi:hypothetical protein